MAYPSDWTGRDRAQARWNKATIFGRVTSTISQQRYSSQETPEEDDYADELAGDEAAGSHRGIYQTKTKKRVAPQQRPTSEQQANAYQGQNYGNIEGHGQQWQGQGNYFPQSSYPQGGFSTPRPQVTSPQQQGSNNINPYQQPYSPPPARPQPYGSSLPPQGIPPLHYSPPPSLHYNNPPPPSHYNSPPPSSHHYSSSPPQQSPPSQYVQTVQYGPSQYASAQQDPYYSPCVYPAAFIVSPV